MHFSLPIELMAAGLATELLSCFKVTLCSAMTVFIGCNTHVFMLLKTTRLYHSDHVFEAYSSLCMAAHDLGGLD